MRGPGAETGSETTKGAEMDRAQRGEQGRTDELASVRTVWRFQEGETHYVIMDGNGEVVLGGKKYPHSEIVLLTLFVFSTKARALTHAESVLGIPADECELIEMNIDDWGLLLERGIVLGVRIDSGSEDEFCSSRRPGVQPRDVPEIRVRPAL